MAALGTLVTIVTADVSGFKTGMAEAGETAKSFSKKVNESMGSSKGFLSGLSADLGQFKSKFTDLKSLVMLGTGLELGEGLFRGIHKGLGNLADGFMESQRAGRGFFDSVGDGISKMAGLETELEAINRRLEENRKLAKSLGEVYGGVDKIDRLLNPETPSPSSTTLSIRGEVDALRAKSRELAGNADDPESAAFGRERLSAAQKSAATSKTWEGSVMAQNELKEAQEKYTKRILAADQAEEQLAIAEKKLAESMERDAQNRGADELHAAHEEDVKAMKELADRKRQLLDQEFASKSEEMAEAARLSELKRRDLEQDENSRIKDAAERRKQDTQDRTDVTSSGSLHDLIQRSVTGGKPISTAEEQEKQRAVLEKIEENQRNVAQFETAGHA